MGRPPANGGPVFRFLPTEVATMEKTLEEWSFNAPSREAIQALADAFSMGPERSGKSTVQYKQVWNWFQNRRHAVKKHSKTIEKPLAVAPQAPAAITPAAGVPAVTAGGKVPEPTKMEFEAKSSRDKAWYDVESFLETRALDTGEPEVRVRFAGFGAEEDEWVKVQMGVRQRSLPCEPAECVAVLPGDLILCFQEGNEQALYFDAHIQEVERRRHDARGCRCRFLVQYDHDGVTEIVALRKVCRRPETEYRLTGKMVGGVPILGDALEILAPTDDRGGAKDPTSLQARNQVIGTT